MPEHLHLGGFIRQRLVALGHEPDEVARQVGVGRSEVL